MSLPFTDADVRTLLGDVVGHGGDVTRIEPLQIRPDAAVLLVTTAADGRLIVKLSGPRAEHTVSFERTAMLSALARSRGVPAPEVLAADDSRQRSRWRYLVARYIDGIPWRAVRPQLASDQIDSAHRQLAAALVAVQSARFHSFGELGRTGQPPVGQDVLTALHRRAELRIRNPPDRASFHGLLDREADLFARQAATVTHDDLHHSNVLFHPHHDGWQLVAILDWDKAWAGPAESDPARMAFWDDMTGPAFWEVYRSHVPTADGEAERTLIYQLLWCFEYDGDSARHTADTARLRRQLGLG